MGIGTSDGEFYESETAHALSSAAYSMPPTASTEAAGAFKSDSGTTLAGSFDASQKLAFNTSEFRRSRRIKDERLPEDGLTPLEVYEEENAINQQTWSDTRTPGQILEESEMVTFTNEGTDPLGFFTYVSPEMVRKNKEIKIKKQLEENPHYQDLQNLNQKLLK